MHGVTPVAHHLSPDCRHALYLSICTVMLITSFFILSLGMQSSGQPVPQNPLQSRMAGIRSFIAQHATSSEYAAQREKVVSEFDKFLKSNDMTLDGCTHEHVLIFMEDYVAEHKGRSESGLISAASLSKVRSMLSGHIRLYITDRPNPALHPLITQFEQAYARFAKSEGVHETSVPPIRLPALIQLHGYFCRRAMALPGRSPDMWLTLRDGALITALWECMGRTRDVTRMRFENILMDDRPIFPLPSSPVPDLPAPGVVVVIAMDTDKSHAGTRAASRSFTRQPATAVPFGEWSFVGFLWALMCHRQSRQMPMAGPIFAAMAHRGDPTSKGLSTSSVNDRLRRAAQLACLDRAYTSYAFKRGAIQEAHQAGATHEQIAGVAHVVTPSIIARYCDPGRHHTPAQVDCSGALASAICPQKRVFD